MKKLMMFTFLGTAAFLSSCTEEKFAEFQENVQQQNDAFNANMAESRESFAKWDSTAGADLHKTLQDQDSSFNAYTAEKRAEFVAWNDSTNAKVEAWRQKMLESIDNH